MDHVLELGLDTFGDVTVGPDGTPVPQPQVIRDVVEQGVLADQVGVDFIGVGEHHRQDFAVSTPDVVLAAIAARTERIRLGSAVTVLSSDDPIRVFQRFATLDAISNGRAEVILGPRLVHRVVPALRLRPRSVRGAVRGEARPVRIAAARGAGHLGGHDARAAHRAAGLPAYRERACGPGSASVAARSPSYAPLATASRSSSRSSVGRPSASRRSPTSTAGRSASSAARSSRSRCTPPGTSPTPTTRPGSRPGRTTRSCTTGSAPSAAGDRPTGCSSRCRSAPQGSLYVGSPETVARKIADTAKLLGLSRFDLKYSMGQLPHPQLMRSIELYGTKVIPMVRDLLA